MSDDHVHPEAELPEERFYQGVILRLQQGHGIGIVRSGSGREIRFVHPFVDVLDGRSLRDLREGMEVGFDVGWTSRGLRVTKIKIES